MKKLFILTASLLSCQAFAGQEEQGIKINGGGTKIQSERIESTISTMGASSFQKSLPSHLSLTSIKLESLNQVELKALSSHKSATDKNVPLKVGTQRILSKTNQDTLNLKNLIWNTSADRKSSAYTIQSDGAKSIRVALSLKQLDRSKVKDVNLRFFGAKNNTVYGPYSLQALIDQVEQYDESEKIYWSPVVDGSTVGVELSVPSDVDIDDIVMPIASISHIGISPLNMHFSGIGNANSCNIDIQCHENTWGDTADAVAKFFYTENGVTYMCTGTALADADSSTAIPYFITANHCVNSQSQAATINTFWLFEKKKL
jgi:hypothetical protein